ncbi:protein kinase [Luteolibacter algae]|uniref:Protein kinase n=1 Tax=Luteolibacter algae TaxID=454151 RepID=A0ABW5D9F7_9BACT
MEDRYEIKGKIGQGGLGAVYRAHDVRMNRDVAIKRIIANSEDAEISEESTRQLLKEAGSLASLQHPNIVTIYDVGSDEDGPYVVMELLAGETLEDIILKGSFTWSDFRELAMQVLEALIAAQELHLVHRDLKPSNIMLTWLPSGKFQVKIVDFGLAKLSAKPSLQTTDQSDGVFGSIYFMAPEQFERVPIDARTDLYAIGCVFYYALTGYYPFDGETAAEVMASHLQHYVNPLQEVRDGIPLWACDWIMWHINRNPSDRPESARQALQNFVENDAAQPSPPMSTGTPSPAPEQPKRPKLVIPGAAPVPEVVPEVTPTQPVKTASAPKALAPPEGSKPSVHTTAQVVQASRAATGLVTPTSSGAPISPPATAPVIPTAKPTQPAASSPPSTPAVTPPTGPKLTPAPTNAATPGKKAVSPIGSKPPATKVSTPQKGLSSSGKVVLGIGTAIVVLILAFVLMQKMRANAEAKTYNSMIEYVAKGDATELPVDKDKLEMLLRAATSVASNKNRYVIYKALFLAKSTDGTDIDARIAEFATTQTMIPDVRVVLIRDVLRKRGNPAIIGTLLDFAESTNEPNAAVAAIEACRFMSDEQQLPAFINIIKTTSNDLIRKAAEENAATIIEKSSSKNSLAADLISAYGAAENDVIRHSMLRLLGRVGGDFALSFAKENLFSKDMKDNIAAIVALATWSGNEGYKLLIEYLASSPEVQLRDRAYDSAIQYAAASPDKVEQNWTLLSEQTKTQNEQLKLIRGLANVDPAPWAFAILENLTKTADSDKVIDLAQRAIQRLKEVQKTKGGK